MMTKGNRRDIYLLFFVRISLFRLVCFADPPNETKNTFSVPSGVVI